MNGTALAQSYLAAWNETDPARRHSLIATAWVEDGTYVDPMMRGAGHQEIDALIRAVHDRFPGFRFDLDGAVDEHHDCLRFGWTLAPEGGAPVAHGTDFAMRAADGRLCAVTGFLDTIPGSVP